MRLVTFRRPGGPPVPGAVVGDAVVDLSDAFDSLGDLVSAGSDVWRAWRAMDGDALRTPLDQVELLAPLVEPRRNLFCTGWNFTDHFDEGVHGKDPDWTFPEHPTFFTKLGSTVIGPGAAIPFDPDLSEQLDYEAELAVVIGTGGRNIPEDKALEHVFGYTIANDVTARDVQRAHGGQWFRGKSLDGTCPLGPAVVTADEVPDPQSLTIRCWVNDDLVQEAATSSMAFPVAVLLSELSRGLTLRPGDVVLTGTPSGVGYARTPPRFLRPGDRVRTSITGLGELHSSVQTADLTSYRRGDPLRACSSDTPEETRGSQ